MSRFIIYMFYNYVSFEQYMWEFSSCEVFVVQCGTVGDLHCFIARVNHDLDYVG